MATTGQQSGSSQEDRSYSSYLTDQIYEWKGQFTLPLVLYRTKSESKLPTKLRKPAESTDIGDTEPQEDILLALGERWLQGLQN